MNKALAGPVVCLVAYVAPNGRSYLGGEERERKGKGKMFPSSSPWGVFPRQSLPFLSGALRAQALGGCSCS